MGGFRSVTSIIMSCCIHLMKSIEHDWSVARHVDICTIEKGYKNQPGSWWAGYPLGSLESESDYSSQRFIERWGLHEPLSLGITTNGIRSAQWMGCENTGEKTKHGLPWWHGMLFFFNNPMWSEDLWQRPGQVEAIPSTIASCWIEKHQSE